MLSQTPINILLVEDDISLLDGVSDLLEMGISRYDVQVSTATNGIEGLASLKKQPSDLIISDITMPHMDGYTFFQNVRQDPQNVGVPFIFLTAKGDQVDIRAGRQSGAEQYIIKPFQSQKLLDLVEAQLDRSLQLRHARVQNLNGLKQSILQVLNHEFRTPLTFVTAYYEMLAQSLDMGTTEPLGDYLKGIQSGCDRMANLVDDLIQVIELRTGEVSKQFEDEAVMVENVGEIWVNAGNNLTNKAQRNQVMVTYEMPATLPPFKTVPLFMTAIATELIENAIKFASYREYEARTVHVRAWTRKDNLYFQVTDNGVGMPEAITAQIYDLFFQHNRAKLEQQGAGVGLTIAKGLIKLHGGKISVSSKEDEGSSFTVIFPLHPQSASSSTSSGNLLGRTATILVVEDDPFLRDGLCDLLNFTQNQQYQFKAISAENGQDALNLLENAKPDLILSDIRMPVMDGYHFLENVRKNSDWVQVPFIFLTAKGDKKEIHLGRQLGVEEYIVKPYNSLDVIEMIVAKLVRYDEVKQVLQTDFSDFKREILALLEPNFRTPLDSVTAYSSEIAEHLDTVETDDELKEALTGLKSASWALSRLVEDFITLAEIKSGETASVLKYESEVLSNFDTVLLDMVEKCRQYHTLDDMIFYMDGVLKMPAIYGNKQTLELCLERLIMACVQLARRSAYHSLVVSSYAHEQKAHIKLQLPTVKMPAGELTLLRQITQQTENTKYTQSDIGTALAVVTGIIHLHNGHIQIDYDGQHGLIFTVSLPISQKKK